MLPAGPVFDEHPQKLRGGVPPHHSGRREQPTPRARLHRAADRTGHEPLTQFLTSVREIEHKTHLDFFPELPKAVQDRMESVKAGRLW